MYSCADALSGRNDGKLQFSCSLRNVCELADLKMKRLLNTLDESAEEQGRAVEFDPPERHAATDWKNRRL